MSKRMFVAVASIDCALIEAPWSFAVSEAAAIEAHWERRVAGNPHLFNGPVLLLHDGAVDDEPDGYAMFRGRCFETTFKAFMAWREFGFPQTEARNIFSMAAVETVDGAFVLGEMAPHTAPAGQIYFPSGTPDRSDIHAGRVDIEGSALRELAEETGLNLSHVEPLPGLILVMDRVRVCCMKPVRASETAEVLVARIEHWLATEARPEFSRMHVIREPKDILPTIPDFVADYLRYRTGTRPVY